MIKVQNFFIRTRIEKVLDTEYPEHIVLTLNKNGKPEAVAGFSHEDFSLIGEASYSSIWLYYNNGKSAYYVDVPYKDMTAVDNELRKLLERRYGKDTIFLFDKIIADCTK